MDRVDAVLNKSLCFLTLAAPIYLMWQVGLFILS
jgi:hypothetical protein